MKDHVLKVNALSSKISLMVSTSQKKLMALGSIVSINNQFANRFVCLSPELERSPEQSQWKHEYLSFPWSKNLDEIANVFEWMYRLHLICLTNLLKFSPRLANVYQRQLPIRTAVCFRQITQENLNWLRKKNHLVYVCH